MMTSSQVYIVAKDFNGISQDYLEKLLSYVSETGPINRALFRREDIPDKFMDQFTRASKLFSEIQNATIQRNITLFKQWGDEKEYINKEKYRISAEFGAR